jgi:hypothetical protein
MKLTEETCNELYAACKAAWGQCLTMRAYLKPPFKGHMESLEKMCKKAIERADAEGSTQDD